MESFIFIDYMCRYGEYTTKVWTDEMNNNTGAFIVFEGIDGCGKTTQIQLLADKMTAAGRICHLTREQTSGACGELLSRILTHRIKADAQVIAALFLADRLDHLTNPSDGLIDIIASGRDVICDRYYMSSYAYQGATLPMEWIMQLNSRCAELLRPTVNIYIDIAPDVAFERICRGRSSLELFEKRDFLEQVRGRYLEVIDRLQGEERIIVIDGNRPENEVAEDIWHMVSALVL